MNFIVICMDSLRRDHVGCYGNDWIRTPNLDKFAKENIVFEHMYPNGVPTLPFRRGLMQGRRPHPFRDPVQQNTHIAQSLLGWHKLCEDYPTMQQVLKENGYVTGMVTDVFHFFPPGMNFHVGFDSVLFVRGNEGDPYWTGATRRQDFEDYSHKELEGTYQSKYLKQYLRNLDEATCEEDYFAPQVFRTAEKWLERNARYFENFYLYIDSFDPHEPWDPPREYRRMYYPDYEGKELLLPQEGSVNQFTDEELKYIKALYAGEITMVDRWFGHFMEKFYNMGLEEDTAVVVVSDHGHPLGEHGMLRKVPPNLRYNLLDAVMLMSLPKGRHGGKRVNRFVHEYDIAPTLLKMAGIERPDTMNGLDFMGLLEDENLKIREYAAGGYQNHTYVRTSDYYLLWNLSEKEKTYLFDLKKDPKMQNNISEDEPEVLEKMINLAKHELDGWDVPEKTGTSGYHKPWNPTYKLRKNGYSSIY